jgi:hypothetical protein
MNAELYGESEHVIVYPKEGTVVIPQDVDFVYIMRKDTAFAMDPIAESVSSGSKHDTVRAALYEAYDMFFAQMTDILHTHFSFKGNMQLHVYDAHYLRQCRA